MHTFDIIMLAVLAGATFWGFSKGMAWQIASIGSLVASYFVAVTFSIPLAPLLSKEEPFNRFLAMLILYVGTSFAIWFGFRFVREAIDKVQLREFDRQVGALCGLAKGVVLCLVITFFAVSLSASTREKVLEAKSGDYITRLIDGAAPIMPKELHAMLDPYLNKLDEGLDRNREFRPANLNDAADRLAPLADDLQKQLAPMADQLGDEATQRVGQELRDRAQNTLDRARTQSLDRAQTERRYKPDWQ